VRLIDRSRLTINSPARIRPSLVPLGDDSEPSVLVLDNVYADPGYVRRVALSLDFLAGRNRFPGFEARVSIDPRPLLEVVNHFVDDRMAFTPLFETQLVFSMISDAVDPRLRRQTAPHTDGDGILAGVVYLNPPHQCRGGTAFYRHVSTGLLERPTRTTPRLAAIMRKHQLRSVDQLARWMMRAQPRKRQRARSTVELLTGSTREWELVRCIEMKCNRLILYFGSLFHSAYLTPASFGDSLATRRLTQTFLLAREDEARGR
jgi:hypothetical protein